MAMFCYQKLLQVDQIHEPFAIKIEISRRFFDSFQQIHHDNRRTNTAAHGVMTPGKSLNINIEVTWFLLFKPKNQSDSSYILCVGWMGCRSGLRGHTDYQTVATGGSRTERDNHEVLKWASGIFVSFHNNIYYPF